MGCGTSSNQIHQVNNPIPQSSILAQSPQKQQQNNLSMNKYYFFGQSLGQRKVVCFNTIKYQFITLSSRIRIPIPTIKLQPIQKLYQQSQQIILPELMEKKPSPPFNFMFATFCNHGAIFLCGGITYEADFVSAQAYFYNVNAQPINKTKNITTKTYIKFLPAPRMSQQRYSHMGMAYTDDKKKIEYIYIFGGKGLRNEPLKTCQKFNLQTKKWVSIKSMLSTRAQGSTILFNHQIYIFGGISSNRQYPQQIQCYHPKKDQWKLLNIQLHRGIKACLVLAHQANSILIFGGNCGDYDLITAIRVNLIQQTYVWQTTLPQPISNIKSIKDSNKLLILSNENNIIYHYDIDNKIWKNLGFGYKTYLPIIDIKQFICVSQPLILQTNSNTILQQQQQSSHLQQKVDNCKNNIQLFILGNQNYPCILSFNQRLSISQQTFFSIKLDHLSMNLHLKSKMSLIPTSHGYFLCGGTLDKSKHSSNQAFLYHPSTPVDKSISSLSQMLEGRFEPGIAYIKQKKHQGEQQSDHIYLFGGIRNNGVTLKSIQKYSFQKNTWQGAGSLLKPKSNPIVHVMDQASSKVIIIGGIDQQDKHSSLIQIYDIDRQQVISYGYFPILKNADNIKQLFIRNLSADELKQTIKYEEIKQIQKSNIKQQQNQSQSNYQYLLPLPTKFQQKQKIIPFSKKNITHPIQIQIKPKKKSNTQQIQPHQNIDEESVISQQHSNSNINQRQFITDRNYQQMSKYSKQSNEQSEQTNRGQNQPQKQSNCSQMQNSNNFQYEQNPFPKSKQTPPLTSPTPSKKQPIINQNIKQKKFHITNSNDRSIQNDLQDIIIEKQLSSFPISNYVDDQQCQLLTPKSNAKNQQLVNEQQCKKKSKFNNGKSNCQDQQINVQLCYGVRIYIYKEKIKPKSANKIPPKQQKSEQKKQQQPSASPKSPKKQQKKFHQKRITSLSIYDLLFNKTNNEIKIYSKNSLKQLNLSNKLQYIFSYSTDNNQKHCFINLSYHNNNGLLMSNSIINPQSDLNTQHLQINTYPIIPHPNLNMDNHGNNNNSNSNYKTIQNLIKYANLSNFSIAKFY